MPTTPGFGINDNKGFHITFRNGVCVSVQFGGGNYCQNYNGDIPSRKGEHCIDAELAIWDRDDAWLTKKFNPREDEVIGGVLPHEVLRALTWAEAYVPEPAEG